ncbi:MAG: hypothetical protein EOM26_00020 [Alphaproteobacteria bacterium]|nr:hypothetical protein [Alphaproteobacteria bacterium]
MAIRHFGSLVLVLVLPLALPACSLLLPLEEDAAAPVSSTYLCEEGRTFNAYFDPEGRKVSLMFEGGSKLLYRQAGTDPAVFATRGLSLRVRGEPSPSLWIERNGIAIYRNCSQAVGE